MVSATPRYPELYFLTPRGLGLLSTRLLSEFKAGQQKLLKCRGLLQFVILGQLPIQPFKELAGLSLILSQIQGPVALNLTFSFLQRSLANVIQGSAFFFFLQRLPHVNLVTFCKQVLLPKACREHHFFKGISVTEICAHCIDDKNSDIGTPLRA